MTDTKPTTSGQHHPSAAARLGRGVLILAGIALLAFTAEHFAGTIPATNGPRRHVINAVTTYAPPVGWTAVIGAIVLAVLAMLLPLLGRGLGGLRGHHDALAATLGHHLKLPPEMLRCRARRTRGRITSGHVRYPRNVPLRVDPEDAVLKALVPYAAGPLTASHTPRKRTITWRMAPPETTPHWWDDIPLLARMHEWLDDLLPGLDIIRERTTVPDDIAADPDSLRITFRYDKTYKDIGPQFTGRVRTVLDKKEPSPTGAWSLIWVPAEKLLIVKPGVALPESQMIPATPPDPRNLPLWSLPIGVRVGNRLAMWQPAKHPHLLLVGATGGGKSSLIRTLIVLALLYQWEVYICDPKLLGYRLMFANGWGMSHDRIATRGETMEAVIGAVHNETMRRYRACEWGLNNPTDFWPVLLVIDENTEALPMMTRAARDDWAKRKEAGEDVSKNPPKESPAVEALWSIARLGREVGVYLALGHQRPDVTYIPGEARDNFLSRYAAGRISDVGAKMLFDRYKVDQRVTKPVIGADGQMEEEQVNGRATVELGNGLEPIQGWWTPNTAKPDECPPGSDEEQFMGHLAEQARTAQEQARHILLPGIIRIDPAAEEAQARAERDAWDAERQRQQALDGTNDPNATTNPLPVLGTDGHPIHHQMVSGTSQPAPAGPFATSPTPPAGDVTTSQTPGHHQLVVDAGGEHQVVANAGGEHHQDAPAGEAAEAHQAGYASSTDADTDPLHQAARLVVSAQSGSTAMVQRELRIGHAKAAQLIRQLAEHGILGTAAGTKARQVLIDNEDDARALLSTTTSQVTSPESAPAETTSATSVPEARSHTAADLTAGDVVFLELDGAAVQVTLDEVDESPTDPDLVELDYRITDDGHPECGQRGTIELQPGATIHQSS